MPVWMTLSFIQGHTCMKTLKKTLVSIFSEILQLVWIKFSLSPQLVGLLKLRLSNVQERELCWRDFVKYTFIIVLYQDTCELICFKLIMMLDTAIHYCLIPVWMTMMMFTKGYRVTRKARIFAVTLLKSWKKQLMMFITVGYVSKMTMK